MTAPKTAKKRKAGAPLGNKNGSKNKIWTDAIRRAVLGGKRLDPLAKRIIEAALDGDMAAMKEIGDRLEGKVTLPVANDGEAFVIEIRR